MSAQMPNLQMLTPEMLNPQMLSPLFLPSPPWSEWLLFGVLPIRAYALCILAGIAVAVVVASRRWRARGGNPETIEVVAMWGVPVGIVGARLYHVITDNELYFGPGKHPIEALYIWNGGLGIWGAVAAGALSTYLVCRHRGVKFAALADACAPGIVLAQGIGRLGNWFNQELYGGPSTLPWALEIDPAHRLAGYESVATYHPTFLYELIWDVLLAIVLIWLDRKLRLGRGKVFVLYVALYCVGRFWVEALRIDPANTFGGFRLNNYTSAIMFVLAAGFFVYLCLRRPGRETDVDATLPRDDEEPAETSTAEGDVSETSTAEGDASDGEGASESEGAAVGEGAAEGDGH